MVKPWEGQALQGMVVVSHGGEEGYGIDFLKLLAKPKLVDATDLVDE